MNKKPIQLSAISLSLFLISSAMENKDIYAPNIIYSENTKTFINFKISTRIRFATINLDYDKIKLQDRKTFEPLDGPTAFTFFLPKCAYAPIKKLFSAIVARNIRIIDQRTRNNYSCHIMPYKNGPYIVKPEHFPLCMTFNPNETIIASGYQHTYQCHLPVPTIQLYNTENGRQITEFGISNDYVHSLAYNQDGNLLASGSENGNIIIWDLSPLKETTKVEEQASLHKDNTKIIDLIFNPDANAQLISGTENQEINIWDFIAKTCLLTLTTESNIQALAFHPAKEHLIALLNNRKIYVWHNLSQEYLNS